MTDSESRPNRGLAGYSLVLLNDLGQLSLEASQPEREGENIIVRLLASRDGEAATQVMASLPDSPENRGFAERVGHAGESGSALAAAPSRSRARLHLQADMLKARVDFAEEGHGRVLLRLRAFESDAANEIVLSLPDTSYGRDVAARVAQAVADAGTQLSCE